jgi:hypothetical protein
MPSKAHKYLDRRLKDIEQLMEAHNALTKFQRARKAAEEGGAQLTQIAKVVDSLVREPGPGRRDEVDALNRAAMVLLSAHLQGFIEDVYSEAADSLLKPHVKDIQTLTDRAKRNFSNPHDYRINQLFETIGLPEIMNGLSWQRSSNKAVRNRLTENIRLRNRIAHGEQERITKAKVNAFRKFVETFAKKFDEKISSEIRTATGKKPW